MRFWPPGRNPAVGAENTRANTGQAGSARHPTIAPGGPRPTGHKINHRVVVVPVVYALPDPLANQLAGSMAMATNTLSPMADGQNYFRGDEGFGVHRFGGRLHEAMQLFGSVTSPITYPGSIRTGMQAGPSSQPAFPGTGLSGGMGSVALMNGAVLGWSN